MMALLGIETSCDETSAAVLTGPADAPKLAALTILSQDVHVIFGGVVPEIASRAHLRTLSTVVDHTLAEAGIDLDDLSAIAVTAGPGLIGALLVGVCFAKGLALGTGIPLVGVHHLEGHVLAPLLEEPDLTPPLVALVVSGGHTVLLDVPAWGRYRLLGATRDDAAGEAFDKVARLLHLPYPGGPAIEKLAANGRDRFAFPRPMIRDGLDFSFSGLKTAVLHAVRATDHPADDRPDLAASFQEAVFDVLAAKAERALKQTGYRTLVVGGGVACSQTLARRLRNQLPRTRVAIAPPRLNADNAAMIARAGWFRFHRNDVSDLHLEADATRPWPGLEAAAPSPPPTVTS